MKAVDWKVSAVTKADTLNNATKWLSIIKVYESATVIFLTNDFVYRIWEIIEDQRLLRSVLGEDYEKYLLAYVPLHSRVLIPAINSVVRDLALKEGIKSGNLSLEQLFDKLNDKRAEVEYDRLLDA